MLSPAELEHRIRAGATMRGLARETGRHFTSVKRLLKRHGVLERLRAEGVRCGCKKIVLHPGPCDHNGTVSAAQIERRALIIAELVTGTPINKIASAFGISSEAVDQYRRFLTPAQQRQRKHSLGASRREASALPTAHRDPLYARVAQAVPATLPASLRDDVISEMVLAVLEGDDVVAVVAAARQFIGAGFRQWASRFGPISLDEARFDDSRATLVDTIADPAALAAFDQFDNLQLGRAA